MQKNKEKLRIGIIFNALISLLNILTSLLCENRNIISYLKKNGAI